MARILAFSSYVAHGHVGLNAIVPALQALGHEVIAVPTVVLSCHYGYKDVGGFALTVDQLRAVMGGISANEWHTSADAILTGFMPSLEVVDALAAALERISERNPDVLYLCDPVIGDDPNGLYVAEEVASAIRDLLVPLADVVTPNRFELAWLTGNDVTDARAADTAADIIGADLVAVTSVPAAGDQMANVMSDVDAAVQFATPRRHGVPHGTGDLFAALLLGHSLNGANHEQAVALASAGVSFVISQSIDRPELNLVATLADAVVATAAVGEPIE